MDVVAPAELLRMKTRHGTWTKAVNAATAEIGRLRYDYGSGQQRISSDGGGVIQFGRGTYEFDGPLLYRSGIEYRGAGKFATVLNFAGACDAFVPDKNNGCLRDETHGTRISDMTIQGDRGLDQAGQSGHGIVLDNSLWTTIRNVELRRFRDAIHVRGASYYTNLEHVDASYNYRSLYAAAKSSAISIQGGTFVVRGDQTNYAPCQIVSESDLAIWGASLEAGSPLIAHVHSTTGRVSLSCRSEGAALVKIPHDGVLGSTFVNAYCGPGEPLLVFANIEAIDPLHKDNYPLNWISGLPAGVRAPGISNRELILPPIEPIGTAEHWEFYRGEATLQMLGGTLFAAGGVRVIKGAEHAYIRHVIAGGVRPMMTVSAIVRLSDDAVFRGVVAGLEGPVQKVLLPAIDYGNGWRLMIAGMPSRSVHNVAVELGLNKSLSPPGSWIEIAHVDLRQGGFAVFPECT